MPNQAQPNTIKAPSKMLPAPASRPKNPVVRSTPGPAVGTDPLAVVAGSGVAAGAGDVAGEGAGAGVGAGVMVGVGAGAGAGTGVGAVTGATLTWSPPPPYQPLLGAGEGAGAGAGVTAINANKVK